MNRFLLLIIVLFSVSAIPDRPMNDRMDGVYELVSSRTGNQNWIAPTWKGMMIVKEGRYSRVYQEKVEISEISYHSNAGSFLYTGKQLKMNVHYSNYRPLVGVLFENQVVWSPDRKLLTLHSKGKENNFIEIWKRVEK